MASKPTLPPADAMDLPMPAQTLPPHLALRVPPGTKQDAENIYVPNKDGTFTRVVKAMLPKGLAQRLMPTPTVEALSPITGQVVDAADQSAAAGRLSSDDLQAQIENLEEALRAPASPIRDKAIAQIKQRIMTLSAQDASRGGERQPIERAGFDARGQPQFRRGEERMDASALQRKVDAGTIDPEELPDPVPVAERQKTPAWKVLKEDKDVFEVQRGDEKPFRVAKAGLNGALVKRIQGFAKGGEVEEQPDAGTVADPVGGFMSTSAVDEDPVLSYVAALPSVPLSAPPMASVESGVIEQPEEPGLLDRIGGAISKASQKQAEMRQYIEDRDRAVAERGAQSLRSMAGGVADAVSGLVARDRPDPEAAELQQRGLMPAKPATVEPLKTFDLQPPPVAPEALAAMPQQEAAPPPLVAAPMGVAPSTGGGYGGSTARDIMAGAKMTEEGIRAEAAARQQKAAQDVALYDQYIKERADLEAESKRMLAEHQARGEELFKAVRDFKIDPNRHWKGMGTGQAATSIVAMILGGLGAGSTGGQNLVVAQIDKTIDRDIAAQEAELGKKQNLLSWHLQQGRDLVAARQLVKADKMDMFAAQLQRSAAQADGPEAAARALQQSGQLRIAAAKERQQANLADLNSSLAQQSLALKRAEDMRGLNELAVPLHGGRIVYALDKEAAKKAREMAAAQGSFMDALDQLVALRKKYGAEAIPSEAAAEGDALLADAKIAYNHAKGLGALDKGSMEVLDTIFGKDVTGVGFVLSRLQAMRKAAQRGFERRITPYLIPAQTGSQGATTLRRADG